MKSNLPATIRSTRSSAALSRAQFSPLPRSFVRDSALRNLSVSVVPESNALTPFWNPRVLDGLQSPLTRFRD